jgi:hypothetical protein
MINGQRVDWMFLPVEPDDVRLSVYTALGLQAERRKLEYVWLMFVRAKPHKLYKGAIYGRVDQELYDKRLMASFAKFVVNEINTRHHGT